jgi:hypothetical protein
MLASQGCARRLPTAGVAGGAYARQARGAHRLLATRQGCCKGCSPSRALCLSVAPHAVLASTALAASHRCSPSAVPPLGHQRAPCAAANLYIGVELCIDEPPFIQTARWYCAGKHMLTSHWHTHTFTYINPVVRWVPRRVSINQLHNQDRTWSRKTTYIIIHRVHSGSLGYKLSLQYLLQYRIQIWYKRVT